MGQPAASLGDNHVCPAFTGNTPHVGGAILNGDPTVLVGNKPAAVATNNCMCNASPPASIVAGSSTVLIGGKPAARLGDSTAHGGKIISGNATVIIG